MNKYWSKSYGLKPGKDTLYIIVGLCKVSVIIIIIMMTTNRYEAIAKY